MPDLHRLTAVLCIAAVLLAAVAPAALGHFEALPAGRLLPDLGLD